MAARTWYRNYNCVILARSFVRSRRGIPRWVPGTYTAQHRQQNRQRRSAVPPTKALADRPNPPSIYTSIPNILKAPQQPPAPWSPWFHSLVRPIQIARSTMMIPSTYLFSATSRRTVCQRPVAKGPRKPHSVTELVYGTACVPAWPFGSQCNSPFLAHLIKVHRTRAEIAYSLSCF